ncbi:hypothetical protein J6590_030154 [Homalodisca vitripennis]|nr:hypothetical protein J6590_030154 [Homalodisca vitripennis]
MNFRRKMGSFGEMLTLTDISTPPPINPSLWAAPTDLISLKTDVGLKELVDGRQQRERFIINDSNMAKRAVRVTSFVYVIGKGLLPGAQPPLHNIAISYSENNSEEFSDVSLEFYVQYRIKITNLLTSK